MSEILTIGYSVEIRIPFTKEFIEKALDKDTDFDEDVSNRPVIVDGFPIGVVANFEVGHNDTYVDVTCVIWSQFMNKFIGRDFYIVAIERWIDGSLYIHIAAIEAEEKG